MPSSSTSAATPVRHSILVVDDEDIILASLKTADRKRWVPSARWNAPIGSHVALHMSMRSAILLLTGLLLAGGPASGAGYLPLIGPAPLRFQIGRAHV